VRADSEQLQHWLIEQRITIAFAPTVVAERLLSLFWPKDGALRLLRFGGERFRGKRDNRHYPFKIYNEYGPTEDTVWTTVAEVVDVAASERNIGYPIANYQVYVLDSNRNRVPVGEVGELCIGGVGLVRGYLNRSELTAEKFVSDPFSESGGERLYRTGDLVRCLPDGSLTFLGRIDDQVKIRGYRIEPGEIEVILSQHPNVRECAVIAREDRVRQERLVAYVVTRGEINLDEKLIGVQVRGRQQAPGGNLGTLLAPRLCSFLSSRLPNYMVPSAFVFLDQLPLTPNGKIDRVALPEPKLSVGQFVGPQTSLQRKLSEIWRDVLDVESVGIHDNFLELGGDSFKAVRLANRLHEIVGDQASAALILQAPTIAELADEICFPTSYAQQSVWLLDQLRPRRWDYNIPLAFRIRGELDVRALERSFPAWYVGMRC
jgi:hypothetical protein